MREISARICTRSFASRFESGSSIRNTCGLADDRTAHRDALPLAAGELGRLALQLGRQARGSRAASSTRRFISSFGVFRTFSANAMLRYTVMCG